MNDIIKSLRERAEIKLDDKRVMALARFKSLDEVLNIFDNLPSSCLRDYDGEDSTWTFGDVPREPSREAYTDKLLKDGDIMDEIMEYIEDYKDKLELEGLSSLQGNFKSCIRRRRFSDDGAEINIDRALSGEPEFWETLKRDGKQEFINIAVQISLSWKNGLKSFAKNMALAYCVCEILENLGYGVCIDILSSVHNQVKYDFMKRTYKLKNFNTSGAESGELIRIKGSEERVDIRNLACTSLPSLLRKYMFGIDVAIYDNSSGECKETTQEYLNFCNVDLLIAKQWVNDTQFENVVQTIKDIIAKKG